jgi:hypothetical protein
MLKRIVCLTLACCAAAAWAQSFCSSDGQPAPTALLERFISADCEACWTSPHASAQLPSQQALALDWIVPGELGDDAPLSAAASRDALLRLEALALAPPRPSMTQHTASPAAGESRLRVAHGLPLADYVGASIEWTATTADAWTAVLLLVEQIPAGTQATPIERHLVRNMLQTSWNARPSAATPDRYFESRPMSLPAGTRVERLRVVGWVQDASGKVVALAQSACQTSAAD